MKLEAIRLKKSPTLTEKWVQDQIAEDPTILGLGDLVLICNSPHRCHWQLVASVFGEDSFTT